MATDVGTDVGCGRFTVGKPGGSDGSQCLENKGRERRGLGLATGQLSEKVSRTFYRNLDGV